MRPTIRPLASNVFSSLVVFCIACTYRAVPINPPVALGSKDSIVILKPVLLSSTFRTPSFKRARYGIDENFEGLADSLIQATLDSGLRDHFPIKYGPSCEYMGVYQKLIPMVLRLGAEWNNDFFLNNVREQHGTFFLTDIGINPLEDKLVILPVVTWGRVYVSYTSYRSSSTSFNHFTGMACIFLLNTKDHAVSYYWIKQERALEPYWNWQRKEFTKAINGLLRSAVYHLIAEADLHVQQLTIPVAKKDTR